MLRRAQTNQQKLLNLELLVDLVPLPQKLAKVGKLANQTRPEFALFLISRTDSRQLELRGGFIT